MPIPKVINVDHPNFILNTLKEICHERGFKFKSQPNECNQWNEWRNFYCVLNSPEMRISFSIQQHPGCCAILDLSYVKVDPWTQENFDYVMKLVEEAAFYAGFAAVMMTQTVSAYSKMLWQHEPWIKGLDRGWQFLPPVRNAKSGNLVTILTKDLEQKGKRQGLEFPIYEQPPVGS